MNTDSIEAPLFEALELYKSYHSGKGEIHILKGLNFSII